MDKMEECNLAWQKHLEKNRLLVLFLELEEKGMMEYASFRNIKYSEHHAGLIISFVNSKTTELYSVTRAVSGAWHGILNDSTGRLFSLNDNILLHELFNKFKWEKFGEYFSKEKREDFIDLKKREKQINQKKNAIIRIMFDEVIH